VATGVHAVMTAHVVVPALDGAPATTSAPVLRILRDELGFDGVVVSDALDMRAISDGMGRAAGAVRALAAGVDLLCVGNPVFPDGYDEVAVLEEVVGAIVAAVDDGSLPLTRLEEASRRVAGLARPRGEVAAETRQAMLAQGAAVAARALSVSGDVRLDGDVLVLVPRAVTGYAAGHKPSALVAELQRRRPGWQYVDVAGAAQAATEAGTAAGRPVAVVVEGADGRRTTELVGAVLGQAPDAVVVYAGLRRVDDLGSRTVHTHGTGAATAVAAADVLLGEVTA